MKFIDLDAKIKSCVSITNAFNNSEKAKAIAKGLDPMMAFQASVQANVARIVNAHGKFYGLRSKYDGNGNKREPMKAALA